MQKNGVPDLNGSQNHMCVEPDVHTFGLMFVALSAKSRKLPLLGFSLQNVIAAADHVNFRGSVSSPGTFRNVRKLRKKKKKEKKNSFK